VQKRASERPRFATIVQWLETRQRLCTVAIGLQSRELPALLMHMIGDEVIGAGVDAVVPIHIRYGMVCAVKHLRRS
jgi:hypothetical protein